MTEPHFDRQHRLEYCARGPEWAFAIAAGDIAALEDVMCRCSAFWNGVNSLIVPVQRDSRIPPSIGELLSVRAVDQCYVHASVEGAKAQETIAKTFGPLARLWDEFNRFEAHPLLFQPLPEDGRAKPSLMIPRFETKALRRIALACWGHVADDDLSTWRERFNVGELHGDDAFGPLLLGQIGVGGATSPLLLSATGMRTVHQRGPFDWPYLAVLGDTSFARLVNFWNWRSRAVTHDLGHAVVGLPVQALRAPAQLRSLPDWLRSTEGYRRTPELLVSATKQQRHAVDAALAAAGLKHQEDDKTATSSGAEVQRRETPLYRFEPPLIGGPFVRGAFASTLIAFAGGRASLALSQPPLIRLTSGHAVRVVLRNLPVPLPIGDATAKRVHRDATAADGVMLNLVTYGDWNFDIALPTRMDALQDFAHDHGASVRVTQDGRYAEALLERLGDLDRLDAVATEAAVAMLQTLTPKSRRKAAQELRRQFAPEGVDIDEDRLVERLQGVGLLLKIDAQSVEALANRVGCEPRAVLATLTPLIHAGLVVRGHELRCPTCNFKQVLDLVELDETVRCRACRTTYVLPVTAANGAREPALSYRLDGLMARAMDQDVLPVLLAHRALRRLFADRLVFAWPGVEFTTARSKVDVDVLLYNQDAVYCCEVKLNAAALHRDQLEKQLALCDALGARPALAALNGHFDEDLQAVVRGRSGLVLTRADLLQH